MVVIVEVLKKMKIAPPHEYLTKRVIRSQIDPPSMCEGFGRTLKGRDILRMRNVILIKTGFLKKKLINYTSVVYRLQV